MITRILCATAGAICFSLLYSVPKNYIPFCGISGAAGWLGYELLLICPYVTETGATFLATTLVVALSRWMAVREACPATVFLTAGIVPLIPGVRIYWAFYYLVANALPEALDHIFSAGKVIGAIVLGIVAVFELPYGFFTRKNGCRTRHR